MSAARVAQKRSPGIHASSAGAMGSGFACLRMRPGTTARRSEAEPAEGTKPGPGVRVAPPGYTLLSQE